MGNTYDEDDDDLYREEDLNSETTVEESVSGTDSSTQSGSVAPVTDSSVQSSSVVPEDGYDSEEDEQALAKSYSLNLEGMDLEVEDSDDEEEDDILSPEERLRIMSNELLSCCIGDKEIRQYAMERLVNYSPRLFRDENYIIFSVMYAYRSKLRKIRIDEEFLKLFLNRNRDLLQRSRGYIDINAYGEVEGSVELGYIGGVVKHFTRLKNFEDFDEEEFETCLEKYLIEFKVQEADKVYNQSRMILTEGLTIGRKSYFGFEDSSNYSRVKLAEIEGLVNPKMGDGYVSMRDILKGEVEDTKKPYKIGDFDKLEALNKVYGGIYTSMFYQVLAPPKAGKTKFCARICHTVAVKYGNNVTVWAQEGGKDAWTAQMRAIHFDYTYNSGKDVIDKKYGISQEVIVNDTYPSDELRELELSSKQDLASNMNYGNIDYVDRPFEVETFLDSIDASVKKNNSKLVIVDYLQLMGSARNLSERERVAEAYRSALVYCKDNNIAFLSPGQFKQEVINELLSRTSTADSDVRTAGGGSSEVFRTPDVIITLWATTQELLNGKMKILSAPARMSKPFPEIEVNHDLAVCQFISVNN